MFSGAGRVLVRCSDGQNSSDIYLDYFFGATFPFSLYLHKNTPMEDRRTFIKKVTCLTGACLCGFPSLVQAASAVENQPTPNPNESLMQDWISNLLLSIDQKADKATHRTIMKSCAISHFEHLQMDQFLSPYIGKVEEFNQFLEKEWGWKVQYQKETGVITADENKAACVCPMVNKVKGVKSSILCYCSEGFAELMFSKVAGHPVKAEVIRSIHRGAATCAYQIDLKS